MLQLKPREERELTRLEGLDSYRYELSRLGISDLSAIHDNTLRPNGADALREDEEMEILTYVLQGTLAYKDNLDNGVLILPGEIHRMTAGTGLVHNEFNPSDMDSVHYLQFRIQPDRPDLSPDCEKAAFSRAELRGRWKCLASREGGAPGDGMGSSVRVHQDVSVYASLISYGEEIIYTPVAGRICWIQVACGVAQLNGKLMEAGDGAAVQGEDVNLESISNEAEILLLDLRHPSA
ncbi:MAG TPA: pirin family protein [Coleofasciculaceae cyanobacterium]